ncbi:MAG: PAS domain S-box protein [Microcoleaceae cyanobacterium]
MGEIQIPILWFIFMGVTAFTASYAGLKTGLLIAGLTSICIIYQAYNFIPLFDNINLAILCIASIILIALVLGQKNNQYRAKLQIQTDSQVDLEKRIKVYHKLLNHVNLDLNFHLKERVQIEEAFKTHTERYQVLATKLESITTHTPIYIYELDCQGNILSVNQTYEGVTPEQVIGTSLLNWFPVEQQNMIQAAIEQAFTTKQTQSLEYSLLNPQGENRFYRTQIAPINISSKIDRAILIANDVTERRQLDVFLHRQALILETIYDGIIVTNLSGNIIDWNSGAERMFGYSKNEVLGKTPAMLHRPEDVNYLTKTVIKEISQKGRWLGEIHFIRKDKTEGICETIVVPLLNNRQELIATVGINHDITQRKQTEAALRKSEERWQLVLRGTNDGIWDHDLKNNQHFLSERCYQLLGYRCEEINTFDKWFALIHPDDQDSMSQAFSAHLNHQTSYYVAEYRMRCQTGDYKWILSRGQAVWDGNNIPIRIVGSITDISAWKQVTTELQQYQTQLEQLVTERTLELTQTNKQLQQEIEARSILAEALLASEARLSGILDNAHDAIISVDENQQIILFNQGAERIFGYTNQDVLHQPLDILLPSATVAIHRQHIRHFGNSLESSCRMNGRREIWGRRCDGTTFPAEASISQLHLGSQTVYTAILRDISDRVAAQHQREQAEMALWDSQRRYATITQVAPVGIFHTSAEGNCSYVNERWCDIAGMSALQAAGQGWVSAIHPQDRPVVFKAWQEAVQQSRLFQLEYRFQRPDGKITWVMGQAVAERDEAGNIQGFVGSITDIHARKQAEAIIREAERRWRSLLENVRLSVVGLNAQGTVEYVNSFFLELTGYSRMEVLGKNWFKMFLRPAEQQSIYQNFQQLLQQDIHNYCQNIILTKQGQEKIIAWNNTRLQSTDGITIGTMNIGEDITERYAIERMKNEFISVVSHELRTPLTAIHGAIDLLYSGLVDPATDRGKQVLKIASESTNRLVRLVNDILELERLESGKITLIKQWVEATDLLLQAQTQLQVMANRAGIKLEVIENSLEFEADSHRLLQVLINLISNAIKFSPRGSTITMSLELNPENIISQLPNSTQIDDGWIIFKVQDRGRGIPTDKINSIFERFHQVDASDSRQKGGTGLGLAICRSIVEQHGGTIWVESQVNQGSCFYFSIPAKLKEQK